MEQIHAIEIKVTKLRVGNTYMRKNGETFWFCKITCIENKKDTLRINFENQFGAIGFVIFSIFEYVYLVKRRA